MTQAPTPDEAAAFLNMLTERSEHRDYVVVYRELNDELNLIMAQSEELAVGRARRYNGVAFRAVTTYEQVEKRSES